MVGAIGLGHDHDAAGVLVEAVDDARPLDAADAGERIAAMMDQRVDQRAGKIACPGMDNQPGRLVQHDQLGILVEDIERDVFALRLGRFRLGKVDRDNFAGRHLALGFRRLAADADHALFDQRLDAASRKIGAELLRQPLVEALAGSVGPSLERDQSGPDQCGLY